jgi:hypothetical protein
VRRWLAMTSSSARRCQAASTSARADSRLALYVELQKKKILLQGGPSLDCFFWCLRDVPDCVRSEPWNLDCSAIFSCSLYCSGYGRKLPCHHSWLRKQHTCYSSGAAMAPRSICCVPGALSLPMNKDSDVRCNLHEHHF